MSSETPRREFLAALGTATVTATAGCNSTSASFDQAANAAGSRTDWPTLGHDGANTGYNPEGRGPRSDATVTWKTEIGMTLGPPVVAGNRVFLTESERLVCFDAKTGNELWEYTPPGSGNVWATPAVRNGSVYVAGPDETVVEVGAKSGTERRQFKTNGTPYAAPRFDRDGRFMFAVTSEGWIHCFDLEDDEEQWQTKVYGSIAGGAAIDPTSFSLYVATEGGEVFGLSKSSGQGYWRRKLPGAIDAAPTVIQNSLYVPTFRGLFCLAADAGVGATNWKAKKGGTVAHHVAVADGTVFGTYGDEVLAIDADSGKTQWSFTMADASLNSPVVAGETLYVGDEAGKVYAIKTGGGTGIAGKRFGAVRWKHDLGMRVREGLAVADGTLFALTEPLDESPMLYALEEP